MHRRYPRSSNALPMLAIKSSGPTPQLTVSLHIGENRIGRTANNNDCSAQFRLCAAQRLGPAAHFMDTVKRNMLQIMGITCWVYEHRVNLLWKSRRITRRHRHRGRKNGIAEPWAMPAQTTGSGLALGLVGARCTLLLVGRVVVLAGALAAPVVEVLREFLVAFPTPCVVIAV